MTVPRFDPRSPLGRSGSAPILAALLLCACLGGCVQRRMTIRSNPPGALVYVDNYEIGTTPVSTHFIYYGTREIRLVKDGYETLTVMQKFPTPWYEYPPLDFIAENLVSGEIRDQRDLTFQLRPQMVVPTEHLMDRAERLRSGSMTGAGFPGQPAPTSPMLQPAQPVLQPTQPPPDLQPIPEGTGGQPIHTLPPGGQPMGSVGP